MALQSCLITFSFFGGGFEPFAAFILVKKQKGDIWVGKYGFRVRLTVENKCTPSLASRDLT